MKSNVFQDAVESSSKVFGRKSDVRVIFEGSSAHTNGNDIVLPALPASAEITVDQQDVIRGYRDHESGHVRCTDTSAKTMKRLTEMTQQSKGLGALVQFCEDIRIEHAMVQAYPGMKHTLSATNKQGAKMMLAQVESRGHAATVLTALPKPLQFRLVLQQVGRSLIGVDSDGIFDKMSEVIKVNDPALYALAKQYGKRMADLPTGYRGNALNEAVSKKGTADAFALAEEIYAAYGKHEEESAPPPAPAPQQPADAPPPPPPPPPDQAGEGDGNDAGADGDAEEDDEDGGTQGSGDSDGDQDEDDQDEDDSEGDDLGDGDPDDADDGDDGEDAGDNSGTPDPQDQPQDGTPNEGPGHGNGMDADQPDDFSIDDMHNQALKGVVDEISNSPAISKGRVLAKGIFNVWSSRFSLKLPIREAVFVSHGISKAEERYYLESADGYMKKIDAGLTGKRAMIRRILELELQARNDRKWESGFKSGRLQSVRLVQALQGRETVYQKREGGKDMDTLLYISLDGSGSMTKGVRSLDAAALAYALSEALERTGCDVIVEMWGDRPAFKTKCAKSNYTKGEYDDSMQALANDVRNRRSQAGYSHKYVSTGVLTRGVIKSKRQRTSDPEVRSGFGLSVHALNSCTPSFHAVFADLKDMSKENHAKKVYLHITDGDADDPLEKQDRTDIMKEAQAYADVIGVHMIGVGICGMSVQHLFKDCVEVSGSDAYEPVIRKLAKLVAGEAGHAAHFKRTA